MPDTQISEEMVERAAAVLRGHGIEIYCPDDGDLDDLERERYDALRDSLTAALSGHVVVPREPTEAMLSAGDSKMPQIAAGQDITTGYDALKEAWPAMIQAAPPVAGHVVGWRTMDSAPKSKNILLFAVTDIGEDGEVKNWKMHSGAFHTGYSAWEWAGRILQPYDVQPTHWQPLPAPPVPEMEGG